MYKHTVILITGDLAAGKTSIGRKIAKRLNIPFFSKDDIKQVLYDSIKQDMSYKEKKKLGALSYAILYHCAKEIMVTGNPFILESNFTIESKPIINELLKEFDYKAILLRVTGDLHILHQRFLKREYGERPMALNAVGMLDDFESFKNNSMKTHAFSLDGVEIQIDTTNWNLVSIEDILKRIEESK